MSLEQLVGRLEAATTRLESLAAGGGSARPAAAAGGGGGSGGAMMEAYDEIMNGSLKNFMDLSKAIGGIVAQQAAFVEQAFVAQRAFLEMASKSKKPADSALPALVKGISDPLTACQEFRDKNRAAKNEANHLAALSEGIPAVGWVMVSPKPVPHVTQMKDSAEFYTNRVLKEFKDKDETQKKWAQAFPAVLGELAAFVKQYHTTGVVWNPNGAEAAAPAGGAAPAAAPSGAPAVAPPPPSTASLIAEPAAADAGRPNAMALFGELNKGTDITSGLKKVDKSQMTHKNPALRNTGPVPAKESSSAGGSKAAPKAEVADKPAVFELQGNKWAVENQKNNSSIVISDTEAKQTVYIFKCQNTTVQIKGKINAVTLDGCKKVAVVVENVISTIDLVNCQSCQTQIIGKCPTVSIDKTDGFQLYLSKDSLETEIMSAKSSEMNVLVPGKSEDDDMVENPIPEQFKTRWNATKGKLVTEIVEHSG